MIKIIQTITRQSQTNVFLVYDDESKQAVLIDPGDKVDEIEKVIEEEDLNLDRILLTHGHYDHIMGVEYYREKYQTKVGAFEKEKVILEDPNKNLTKMIGQSSRIICDEYYQEGDVVSALEFQVLYTPGHTIGSCSYQIEDKLFTGDAIFYNSVGRWDLPSGDLSQTFDTIAKIVTGEELLLYPGHGQATDSIYERLTNPFSPDKQ